MLGIVGNCKKKEKFINPILQLDERYQAVLMDIMLKYMKNDDGRKSMMIAADIDSISDMQKQLKEREEEKLHLLEQLAKMEKDNREYNDSFSKLELKMQEFERENTQLKDELKMWQVKSVEEVELAGKSEKDIEAAYLNYVIIKNK